MKAITVRQPWAWAIIHGGKDVENRSRNIAGRYRGPLAIHAALADADNAPDALWLKAAADRDHAVLVEPGKSRETWQPRGVVLGIVDLTDSHPSKRSSTWAHMGEPVCFDSETPTGALCSEWADRDCWHLVLANPRPLAAPVPYKGRLGVWDVPDELVADLALAADGGQ